MKTQFKLLMLMLITSVMCSAQSHRIIQKSMAVDKNTSLVLNFENIYVAIEESPDNKIHFDYIMEFEGYSKKEIQKKLDEIKVEATSFDNIISLKATSEQQITFATYEFKGDYGISIEDDFFGAKKDSVIRKSKDSLLAEIKKNNKTNWSKNPLEFIQGKFKKVDKDGNLSNINKGNVDIMRSRFLIKIPRNVKININARNSGVHFRNDVQNEVSIDIKQGTLKTKELANPYNRVKVDNANFEAEKIKGGNYDFKNVKYGKIGSVEQVKINSEFSKIEIGEIQKLSIITDFNSEYWFYNWSDNFKRFNLYSEYSKIHFFYPVLNFSLKVIGNNTKSFMKNDVVIDMQPTKGNEKFTMMTTDAHGDKPFSGEIYFDIVHGIIYSNDYWLTLMNHGNKD